MSRAELVSEAELALRLAENSKALGEQADAHSDALDKLIAAAGYEPFEIVREAYDRLYPPRQRKHKQQSTDAQQASDANLVLPVDDQPNTYDVPEYRTRRIGGSTYAVVLVAGGRVQDVARGLDRTLALQVATALNEFEGF